MNEVSGITPVGSGSNSPSQEKIALLQAQMQHYAESANASIKATADYKALQYAIRTDNISDAQADIARLRQENQVAAPANSALEPDSPVGSGGGDADSGQSPSSIDAKA